jgi:hypothetical protein
MGIREQMKRKELWIPALVVCLLVGVALLRVYFATGTDPQSRTVIHMDRIVDAVEEYYGTTGELPPALTYLERQDDSIARIRDVWGGAITYEIRAGRVWLISYGADGEPGGTGQNADLKMEFGPEDTMPPVVHFDP